MSIFDKLRKDIGETAKPVITQAKNTDSKTETFIFANLSESLEQLQALPEAALSTPFQTAALTVCALCAYGADKTVGEEMLNWLRGPRPLSGYDISF